VQRVDKYENVNAEHDEDHIEDDLCDVEVVVDDFKDVALVFQEQGLLRAGHEDLVDEVNEVDGEENRGEDKSYSKRLNLGRIFLQND
jgi:hypothetical protein